VFGSSLGLCIVFSGFRVPLEPYGASSGFVLGTVEITPARSIYHAWNYTFLGYLAFILYSCNPF
ncbi:hypothetical protein TorRG33x02_071920, partial [Trema orientale]